MRKRLFILGAVLFGCNNFLSGQVTFEKIITKGNIEILNMLGIEVFEENIINETKKEIHLNNISSGIYFVKVYVYSDLIGNGEKYYCRKLIVE